MKRKYYTNSYVGRFNTKILREETLKDGRHLVVLEETYFYPTSGGQPHDLGTIAGVKVLDVVDGDEILHVVERPIGLEEVECEIDWKRRFDHMQQHAGQHILSACFEKLYDAETVGFHLGDEYVTIDVTLDELTSAMAQKVEDAANELIYRNLLIKTYFVKPEELKNLPLRKPPVVDKNIRIVEIDGEDYSPCGGTHPKTTGEIGIIKIRKWEKKRANIRVEFVCGYRALADYQWKNDQINQVSNLLSIKDKETLDGVTRLYEELKDLRREVRKLKGQMLEYEAQKYYNMAREINGIRLISQIVTDRDLGEVKQLANKIVEKERVIVLFGVKGEKAQVSFSRSDDLDVNMNELLKEVIGLINGGGGGNARSAQGGGTDINNLENLLKSAEIILKNRYLK
ncbi:hypothetical protein BBF96_01080 [Anoxybacter fermentans]|uniref:Alanine--tRNA ligase n=1 Tax=Anoxybacter fermentans TaxID=1323375 RepID=A0A3S9SUW5_9FIRM|nr:DHHA1 domain-containing protein [Anoxybacter fermentans]AZR72107.1 hypothetical protein BBF96_01080 [Anoxybacter fermentans]